MGNTKLVRVHQSIIPVFENIRRGVADDIKKKYGLKEIVVPHTLSSEILAAEKLGKKPIFKLKKTGLNSGVLELFWK